MMIYYKNTFELDENKNNNKKGKYGQKNNINKRPTCLPFTLKYNHFTTMPIITTTVTTIKYK